jgi:hypothetical protein
MHPKERVLGLMRLHQMRGETIPSELIDQAKALGIDPTKIQNFIDQQPKQK